MLSLVLPGSTACPVPLEMLQPSLLLVAVTNTGHSRLGEEKIYFIFKCIVHHEGSQGRDSC